MKKRKDCFWGLHSDFHASPRCEEIGTTLKEEEIREICRLLKPSYWGVDSKGHPGWASYPSEIGNAMPKFACDTLALWRKVTREEDVALYVHYSGVKDEKYCADYPQEAAMLADGTRSKKGGTRLLGRYVEDRVIPQLLEMIERYGVDGVWMDGECWGVEVDYHPETLAAFETEYGVKLNGQLPKTPEDPYYLEYREFNRELFRRYLRKYIDTIHAVYPDFQIASNWMYSDDAMEPITTDVDYLSGDLDPWDCVNWARYSGRALAQQPLSWDLMGWGIRALMENRFSLLYVHPAQLIQEAAAVISLGGGFQVYIPQYADGSPRMEDLRQLKPVADFMHSREAFCFHVKPIHQAAMLLSTYDRKREIMEPVYGRGNTLPKVGLCSLLCDAGQSLEIVSEHTLDGHYDDYPLLVIPEVEAALDPKTVQDLLDYARRGGNLLLTGANTCRIFAKAGLPYHVTPVVKEDEMVTQEYSRRYFTLDGKKFGGAMEPVIVIPDQPEKSEIVATSCYDYRSAKRPYAILMEYGAGKITAIGGNVGKQYNQEIQYLLRTLVKTIADKMYTPKARIESALGLLEIVATEKDGRFLLQMVNANGNHTNPNCATEDQIPPVLDIELSVAWENAPEKVVLQPENRELSFEYRDGRIYIRLDRLDMHGVLEIF